MMRSLERVSKTDIAITIRAPYQELEPILATAAKQISETTDFEGFRKGKAPYDVVKAKVGEYNILESAARLYIERNFSRVLKEVEEHEYRGISFEPVGEPQVAITKLAPGEELEFKITLALLPPLSLPDYRTAAKRILATEHIPGTTEKEVEDAIEWLRESRAKLVTVDRGAKTGDRVEIDFSASSGGVPMGQGASKNHPFIIGRGKFPPGFESALLGMKAGEEKTFAITIPPDYGDRTIAGKNIEFNAAMNLVQSREVPAWDDAFAKSIGDSTSAEAAAKNIRDGLRVEKEKKERERIRMAMADAIANEAKAAIPPVLLERELEKMLTELKGSIGSMGLAFADYLLHIKKTDADLKREWRGDAERRVKIALVLREIAKAEHIEPSEAEVEEAISRTVTHQGMSGDDIKSLDREAFIRYHVGIARNEKVFQFLEATL